MMMIGRLAVSIRRAVGLKHNATLVKPVSIVTFVAELYDQKKNPDCAAQCANCFSTVQRFP